MNLLTDSFIHLFITDSYQTNNIHPVCAGTIDVHTCGFCPRSWASDSAQGPIT